jgi:hypothetical protein
MQPRKLLLHLGLGLVVLLYGCTPKPISSTPSRLVAIPENAVKITPEMDGFPPILHVDGWAQPIPLEGPINTSGGEDSPFILPDGSTLYFFFTPDVSIPAEKQVLDQVTGIYVSHRINETWSDPDRVILQDPGKLALDGCPFVQEDTIWFCSAREGYTGLGIFTVQYQQNTYTNWQRAAEVFQVGELHFSADGEELYFQADLPGGRGGYDLWMKENNDTGWSAAKNLSAVNTPNTEGWPFLSQDGRELWFTRQYNGSPGIFRSIRTESGWTEAELILSQFAGEPTLDRGGNLYFVHHFYQEEQMIEADIYVSYREK